MKNVAIFGSWWGGNIGDVSILYSMLFNLPTNKVDRVIVHSKNPNLLKHHIEEYDFVEIRDSITNYWGRQTIDTISSSDVIIIGGGGLIFSKNIYDPFYSHIFNLYPVSKISGMFDTDIKIYSIGASHLEGKFSKVITKSILSSASSITVRDQHTREIVSQLGIQTPRITPDPAFSLPIYRSETIENIVKNIEEPFMVFSIHNDLTKYSNFSNKQVAKKLIAKVSNMAKENDLNILLYNNYVEDEWLQSLKKEFSTDLQVYTIPRDITLKPPEIVALLSTASLVVASQMHVNIMSIVAKTPNIAIEYDTKVRSMMKYVGLTDQIIGLENIEAKFQEPILNYRRIDDGKLNRMRGTIETDIQKLVLDC